MKTIKEYSKYNTKGFPEGSRCRGIDLSNSALLFLPTKTPGRSLKFAPLEPQNKYKNKSSKALELPNIILSTKK